MNNNMIIPDNIHVGYNNRKDTYTGKLAYVIYTDKKGVKRKEHSWNNWRDKAIDPTDFKNEPTSGFVLNKGVGGARQSWGWNTRNEYIRIYDPRGFEFEISVANLLFILQETSSIKGKGLEGDFVYAWDRADLVLLPACSQEYKDCTDYTNLQTMKITKNDMVVGCEYVNKKGENLIYMGRGKFYTEEGWDYDRLTDIRVDHIYAYHIENEKYGFKRVSGFTHLAKKVSDTEYGDFPNVLQQFNETGHMLDFKRFVLNERATYQNYKWDWVDNTRQKIFFDQKVDVVYKKVDDNTYTKYIIDYYYKGGGILQPERTTQYYLRQVSVVTFDDKKGFTVEEKNIENSFERFSRSRKHSPFNLVEEIPDKNTIPEDYGSLYLELENGKQFLI